MNQLRAGGAVRSRGRLIGNLRPLSIQYSPGNTVVYYCKTHTDNVFLFCSVYCIQYIMNTVQYLYCIILYSTVVFISCTVQYCTVSVLNNKEQIQLYTCIWDAGWGFFHNYCNTVLLIQFNMIPVQVMYCIIMCRWPVMMRVTVWVWGWEWGSISFIQGQGVTECGCAFCVWLTQILNIVS